MRSKKNYGRPVKPSRMQRNAKNARYFLAEILVRFSRNPMNHMH